MSAPEVVTLGEVLGTVSAGAPGPLEIGSAMRLSFAGAEATVALAAARLGVRSAWMGCLGDDPLGRLVLDRLRAEGVDVSAVQVLPECFTALLLKFARTADRVEVSYLRRGSAGAQLAPDDVDESLVRGARVLHVTGITPALGPGPEAAVRRAIDIARAAGVAISLDVNYRSRLWTREDASLVLGDLAGAADVVFASAEELELVAADPGQLLRSGVGEVVVTDGPRGATVFSAEGETALPAHPVRVVDPVGAGDAFVGGYLAAFVRGRPISERLRQGTMLGSFAVSTLGDWEGLPRQAELDFPALEDVAR